MNKLPFILREEADGGAGDGVGTSNNAQGGSSSIFGTSASSGDVQGSSGTQPNGNADSGTRENFWRGMVNEDGTLNHDRFEHLPPELQGLRNQLKNFRSINDLFKTYDHQSRLIGKKGLQPLPETASDEERQQFVSRLREVQGCPTDPTGYGFKKPDNVPDEAWNGEFANEIQQVLFDGAVSPQVAQKLFEINQKYAANGQEAIARQQAEAFDQHIETERTKLKEAFGLDSKRQEELARRGARAAGIDVNSPLFNQNAEMVILAAKYGATLKEGQFIDGNAENGSGASAAEEMAAMANDKSHRFYNALRNPQDRRHNEALQYRRNLAKQITGER